ncbi:MAG: sigma-70 family RNA polymerase sigma factor [Candidatus Latescibacteria bacterium]|nr:sigma-70 family RNA polymerase sigma factor [Candidatus Latescibacterota bacterium]
MSKKKADKPVSGPSGNLTVQRAQDGDLGAFEELYRTHMDRVFALCLRLTASEERAQQLTQDTFVLAWEKLSSFRGEAAFATWLHRLAVNTVLQDKRARRRRRERIVSAEDASLIVEAYVVPTPEDRIDLERAIAQLPRRARTVFVLHDVEGYRHEEIAEMMKTSIGTSKAQLHRARNLLRKMLAR